MSTGMPRFKSFLIDQQRAQEQVLEVLPLVSEVNAMSEELNKHKYVIIGPFIREKISRSLLWPRLT